MHKKLQIKAINLGDKWSESTKECWCLFQRWPKKFPENIYVRFPCTRVNIKTNRIEVRNRNDRTTVTATITLVARVNCSSSEPSHLRGAEGIRGEGGGVVVRGSWIRD